MKNNISFNLRVYGLLINDKQEILVSDECRHGFSMTKFPGGGLEFGEGLIDGLKREYIEELGVEIEVKELFYVNDFLQISAFNKNQQLISFYYKVEISDYSLFEIQKTGHPSDYDGGIQRWIPLSDISEEDVTFPIDKIVVQLLKKKIQNSII